MTFEILIIISAAVIFITLARRLPETGEGVEGAHAGIHKEHRVSKFKVKLPRISLRFPVRLTIPKIKLRKKPQLIHPVHPEFVRADDLIHDADELMESGDLRGAEEFYLKAASKMPDNPKIYNRLGIIYLQQKNFADARDAFLAGLKLDDKHASRNFNLALAYIGLGTTEKAKVAVKRAIELDPTNKKYQQSLTDLETDTKSA